MKKQLTMLSIILVILVITGCSTSRHVALDQTNTTTQVTTQVNQVTQDQATINTATQGITTTVTQDQMDTNLVIPGHQVTGSKPLNEILAGSPMMVDANGDTLLVTYDSKLKRIQGVLITGQKNIHGRFTRQTKKTEAIQARSTTNQTGTTTMTATTKSSQETNHLVKDTQVKRPNWARYIVGACLILAIIIVLIVVAQFRGKFHILDKIRSWLK